MFYSGGIEYLAVHYDEKEEVKKLGAMWDPNKKKWYVLSNHPHLKLFDKWKINTEPVILKNEDRSYGGNELFIDLTPEQFFFKNVCSFMDWREWDRLNNHVCTRVNNTCECCHKRTNHIKACERWHYDNDTKTRKLVRLIALCGMCKMVTHIGQARINSTETEALEHLKQIRNFTHEKAIEHQTQAYKVWAERCRIDWNLDLSLLTNNNIKIYNIIQ